MSVARIVTVWAFSVSTMVGAPCIWKKGTSVTVAGTVADQLHRGSRQEFFSMHVQQQEGSECTGDVRITLFDKQHLTADCLRKGKSITVHGRVDFFYGEYEVIPEFDSDITCPKPSVFLYCLGGLVAIAILVIGLLPRFKREQVASQSKEPNPELAELRLKVESVETKVAELERRIDTTEVAAMMKVEVGRLAHQDGSLAEDIGRLNERLTALIPQEGIEPPEFFKDAAIWSEFQSGIINAKVRIDIESPWISSNVVRKLVLPLDGALQRGVKVRIRYGYRDKSSSDTEKQAVALRERFSSYGSLFVMRHDNTHGKAFICDNTFLLVGSYNFLSFAGEFNADTRSEMVVKIRDGNAISKLRTQTFSF